MCIQATPSLAPHGTIPLSLSSGDSPTQCLLRFGHNSSLSFTRKSKVVFCLIFKYEDRVSVCQNQMSLIFRFFLRWEKKLHEGLEEIRLASYKSIDLADYKM